MGLSSRWQSSHAVTSALVTPGVLTLHNVTPGGGLRCEGYWGASGSPSSLSIPMLCQYSCHVLNKAEPSFISSKYIVLATNSCSHFPCECCAQCLVQTGEGERKNAIGKTALSDTVIDVSLVQEVSLAHMEHFWWIQAQTL